MKVGIISDLHGYPSPFKKALQIFQGCDMILCAGDVLYHGPRNPILEGYNPQGLVEEIKKCGIPILIARGNCDAEVDEMVLGLPIITNYIVYEKDNTRFIVNHGHTLEEDRLRSLGEIYRADVVITGHTHVRKCEEYNGSLFINPGSVAVPKGDGIPSVAVFEDREICFFNVQNGEVIDKGHFLGVK